MAKYKCDVCGYMYDPEKNKGIDFKEIPDSWTCPMCGVGKEYFS